jgi:capsular polysaccharide biosynthesis protein
VNPPTLIENDRTEFFREVLRRDARLEELLRFYIRYAGPLFPDQWAHLKQRLAILLKTEGINVSPETVFSNDRAIAPGFSREYFPHFAELYFSSASHESFSAVEILPPSPNELCNNDFPPTLGHRSSRTVRPGFSAYVSHGGTLFVGPNQYQYFDSDRDVYYPAASLRAFSRDILKYRRLRLPGTVVLIQDFGNGTNFAHFAFDWLTRVMFSLETGLVDIRSCTFIMGGGAIGAFQAATLSAIFCMYGLTWDNFFFPLERVLIDIDGSFIFFSDQKLRPAHPAQMAHPRSIELLRRLNSYLPSERHLNVTRLFISRSDAKFRRIKNEEELIAIAAQRGYKSISLASLNMADQFALVRGARQIAGAHGMGFAHIFLNDGPLSVLELFNPTQGTDAYSMISRALGFEYDFEIGDDLGDNRASYRIDPMGFSRRLDAMPQ